jgi:hypothetical protein
MENAIFDSEDTPEKNAFHVLKNDPYCTNRINRCGLTQALLDGRHHGEKNVIFITISRNV